MSIEGSNGDKKLPGWVAFLLGLAATIVSGAIGYGELKASHEALSLRVEQIEARAREHEVDAREREREIRALVSATDARVAAMDRNIVRICSKLKAGCEE